MTRPRHISPPRLLVSIPEAAAMLGYNETLFRREVLPFVVRIEVGRDPRIDVEDLRSWVDVQKRTRSGGKGTGRTRRASPSTANGSKSSPANATAKSLTESLAKPTRKRSKVASVVQLEAERSQRRSPADG